MMRQIKFVCTILLVGAAWLLLYSCKSPIKTKVPTDTKDNGTIKISVDESFKPVIEEQIRVFEASNPNAKIEATYKSEADCLRDFYIDSNTRMIIVTRGLRKQEQEYFSDSLGYIPFWNRIASDAIVVLINRQSKDTLFTMHDLQLQLTGKAKNQKKIVFDGLNATSSVRYATDSILRGQSFDLTKVKAVKSSKEVIDYIATDTNAIGFVGFSWIGNPEDTAQVRMLKKVKMAYIGCNACVDTPFVKPTQAGIVSKRYPLVHGIFYILKENYAGLGSGFASFMLYERGQLIFRRAYLSPSKMNFDVRKVKINEKLKKD